MRIQKYIFLFYLLLFYEVCKSQYIDSETVNRLENKHSLTYIDDKGRFIGDKPMEASPIKVVFYTFLLNKPEGKATIEGRIIDPSVIGDSIGVRNYIFLATPIGNKLTKLRIFEPSYSRRLNDPHEDIFPYRNGDFKIEFSFNHNERLYFNGEMTFPVEYNIGKLLVRK